MSFTVLKCIAIFTMLIDHIGVLFGGSHTLFMRLIGRVAAPVFLFGIANGYRHTKNVRRYALRILVFALASQLPYLFFLQQQAVVEAEKFFWQQAPLNFLFTLGLGLISTWAYHRVGQKHSQLAGFLTALLPALAGEVLRAEGGAAYVLLVLLFDLTMGLPVWKKALLWLPVFPVIFSGALFSLFVSPGQFDPGLMFVCAFGPYLGALVTFFYNGKKGSDNKWMQYAVYAFYPVHLFILAAAKALL